MSIFLVLAWKNKESESHAVATDLHSVPADLAEIISISM